MAPPRVAPENPLEGQDAAFEKPVFAKRLKGVLGAGGIEATTGGKKRRDKEAVNLDDQDSNVLH